MASGNDKVEAFIERWAAASGGERSNYQLFLTELCDIIGVDKSDPSVEDNSRNAYVFERSVEAKRLEGKSTTNFIDLYKRGCFVLEAKQSKKRQQEIADLKQLGLSLPEQETGSGRRDGTGWDTIMRNARQQAEGYAKRLPAEEGWPPFLITVDVGHVIELFADFSLQGKHYAQFPDRQGFRIFLSDLRDEKVRERLRYVWNDPNVLNPARRTAEVTREVADFLARLSKSLETRLLSELPRRQSRKDAALDRTLVAQKVSTFLMRCLFTMFAEDVGLLPRDCFLELLRSFVGKADKLHIKLEGLWKEMNDGGFSTQIDEDILHFNGGLFRDSAAIPITEDELNLLIIAAQRDWKDVEPAIFGTLLEQALDPKERHQLGAHYTPRAYVERLVVATIIEPLTEDWQNVQAVAASQIAAGNLDAAVESVTSFHRELCEVQVLDPACGTGNFLYVAMELMKRLEGEVLETLVDLGEPQANLELDRHTVDPHQFLGLEINPRAVAIAELVLWIGYLQWHFRTRGRTMPAEPVLKNFHNIVERDALLKYDSWDVLRDDTGRPITRWDGITYKLHPITGEQIPDEDSRVEFRTYLNPRRAEWPEADFIVGNPPFLGGKDMRQELGDGYAEACWKARRHVPGGADFVMHFWDKAAELVRNKKVRRFGLISTNSITQKFSRRVVDRHLSDQKKPLSLILAIPDHPWMKSADRAAVRIAMTVGAPGRDEGQLRKVTGEYGLDTDSPSVELDRTVGKIHADLSIGPDVSSAFPLTSNAFLSSRGVALHGAGFIVTSAQASSLGLGKDKGLEDFILDYRNGKDLTDHPREVMIIDFFP